MIDNDTLPVMDDSQDQGPSEQDLLDAVMANSPIMEESGVPLPDEEENVVDPEESEYEDPEDSEEAVSEDGDEEEVYDEEGEDDAPEASTDEPSEWHAADLDQEVTINGLVVDGEETSATMADLIKSYQTDVHFSNEGRKLGEARKELEAERQQALEQIGQVSEASAAILMQAEQGAAKEFHSFEEDIAKARAAGDTYELNELKDKREQAQQKYWAARQQRESLMQAVQQQKAQAEQEQWDKQMEYFNQKIPELIPDFNEERATKIRDFALDYGLSPDILDTIADPLIVKALDEFRQLKQAQSKGVKRRKAVPTKKSIPTKKAKTPQRKQQDREAVVRAKGLSENASEADQMDFLRQHASRTLNNL